MTDPSLIKRQWPFWEAFITKHQLDITLREWEMASNDNLLLAYAQRKLRESYDYDAERSSEQW